MPAPVSNGNILAIPAGLDTGKVVTITWSQSFRERTADYVVFVVKNKSENNAVVVLFIEKEWANAEHLKSVASESDGGKSRAFEFKIDSKSQYGQKNSAGDMRFVVYHDQSRKPYQHRFVQTSLLSAGAGLAKEIADAWGQGDLAGQLNTLAGNFVGDYLHTF